VDSRCAPSSLKIVMKQLAFGEDLFIEDCLKQEYDVAVRLLDSPGQMVHSVLGGHQEA
jgi:hypothetical protein